ncbi:MAG: hypothetical protein Q9190_000156 [Brigantiaea leucoxantha]
MSNSQISTHGTQKEDDNAVSDIYGVHPCAGNLVALRTRAEVEASNSQSLVLAYAVEIPPRSANDVLKALDAVIRIEGQGFVNVQHLRRIVRPQDLPPRFRDQDSGIIRDGNRNTQFTFSSSTKGLEPLLTDKVQTTDLSESLRPLGRHQSLFLFICLASILPVSTIESTLSAYFHSPSSNATPTIFTILVPLLPPSSESEAKQWSDEWWPTVYKKHNPFGPQPSAVAKAEAEIYETAGLWMGLARRVAEEVKELEIGEKVGAVVVDRHLNGGAKIVAIAGDARWNGKFRAERAAAGYGCGNAMAHAVIRAIGLVARKRREALHFSFLSNSSNATSSARVGTRRSKAFTSNGEYQLRRNPAHTSRNTLLHPQSHPSKRLPLSRFGYLCHARALHHVLDGDIAFTLRESDFRGRDAEDWGDECGSVQ